MSIAAPSIMATGNGAPSGAHYKERIGEITNE